LLAAISKYDLAQFFPINFPTLAQDFLSELGNQLVPKWFFTQQLVSQLVGLQGRDSDGFQYPESLAFSGPGSSRKADHSGPGNHEPLPYFPVDCWKAL
jgi:hypothetical protein